MEQVHIPARMGSLKNIRNFIAQIGLKYNLSSSDLYAFKASVDEACSNIIEHGYGFNDGSITAKAIISDHSLTIEIIDQGKTFNPNTLTKPDLQDYVQNGKKGGLGIFIMRRLLDEVDYQKTESGNVLRLTKYRQPISSAELTLPAISFVQRVKNMLSLARL